MRRIVSEGDGSFAFPGVAAGAYSITVSAAGFTPASESGSVLVGQQQELARIALHAATNIAVEVSATPHDIAQAQIGLAEQQRVLGFIPNFYVSYDAHPEPLARRQKFELAWKMSVDPMNFVITGFIAGVQQSQNTFGGYGQGTQGYAKRFGATYGDAIVGTMLSNAILPAVFKQDPRYFYKGTGRVASRGLYAAANAVICKGDNGRWQANYSNILGSFAAAGISNLYYPAADRNGIRLTAQETLIGLAAAAGGNLFQEFLVRRLTPHTHRETPAAGE